MTALQLVAILSGPVALLVIGGLGYLLVRHDH
jgi:hypothetical protein